MGDSEMMLVPYLRFQACLSKSVNDLHLDIPESREPSHLEKVEPACFPLSLLLNVSQIAQECTTEGCSACVELSGESKINEYLIQLVEPSVRNVHSVATVIFHCIKIVGVYIDCVVQWPYKVEKRTPSLNYQYRRN